jgi:hypothetical protein
MDGEKVVLACGHEFCIGCLNGWARTQRLKKCPLCARKVSVNGSDILSGYNTTIVTTIRPEIICLFGVFVIIILFSFLVALIVNLNPCSDALYSDEPSMVIDVFKILSEGQRVNIIDIVNSLVTELTHGETT